MNEILEGLAKKLESGTCTPLEVFNIKMYVALLDKDVLKRMAKKETLYRTEIYKRDHIPGRSTT